MKLFKNISLTLLVLFLAFTNARASDDEGVEEVAPVTPTLPENGKVLGTQTNDILPLILSKTTTDEDGRVIPILSIRDLGNCAQVCKTWQAISEKDIVWNLHAERRFRLNSFKDSTYQLFSPRFRTVMGLTPHFKQLFKDIPTIVKELGAYAALGSKNSAEIYRKLNFVIELLGDNSAIKTNLNCKLNEYTVRGQPQKLAQLIESYIALGSQFAIQYKKDNKEFLPAGD